MQSVSLFTAFLAGLISFVSPCVLPLVPGYISFISGFTLQELRGQTLKSRFTILTTTLFFILGFSTIFITLGATATALGSLVAQYQSVFQKIAGLLIIVMGLHFTGIYRIPWLDIEKRVHLQKRPFGKMGAFFIGMAFAFGWTPCIGPILAAILLKASTAENVTEGIGLLAAYSLGLGIPFLITGISIQLFYSAFERIKRHYRAIEIGSGILLLLIGLLMLTNQLPWLARFFPQIGY